MRITVKHLESAISQLPKPSEHVDNEFIFTVDEPLDPNSSLRPTEINRIPLVFHKNFHKNGWDMVFNNNAFNSSIESV
jgi:hypothetical protein